MNTVKTILITLAGLSVAIIATLFTASVVLAFAGIATVLLAARAISLRMQSKPVRAHVYARSGNRREIHRVWNDGKGTIIDM